MALWDDLLAEYERGQAERDPAVGPSDARVLVPGKGCVRQLAYRTQRVPATDPEPEHRTRAAIIGEAIHAQVATARRAAGWAMVEADVTPPGFPRAGRLDGYEAGRLDDLKTVSSRVFARVLELGKARPEDALQLDPYGLAVVALGLPLHTLSITYVNRDNGEDFTDSWSWDPESAWRTAIAMYRVIDAAAKPSAELGRAARTPHGRPCDGCPWRTACWGTLSLTPEDVVTPAPVDVAAAARELKAALGQRAELEERIERLRHEVGAAHGMRFEDQEGIMREIRWSSGRPPGEGGALDQGRARALLEYHGELSPTLGTAPRLSMPAVR